MVPGTSTFPSAQAFCTRESNSSPSTSRQISCTLARIPIHYLLPSSLVIMCLHSFPIQTGKYLGKVWLKISSRTVTAAAW